MIGYTEMGVGELLEILQCVFSQNKRNATGLQFIDTQGRSVDLERVVVEHDAQQMVVSTVPPQEETRRDVMAMLYPDLPKSMESLKRGERRRADAG